MLRVFSHFHRFPPVLSCPTSRTSTSFVGSRQNPIAYAHFCTRRSVSFEIKSLPTTAPPPQLPKIQKFRTWEHPTAANRVCTMIGASLCETVAGVGRRSYEHSGNWRLTWKENWFFILFSIDNQKGRKIDINKLCDR